MDFPSRADLFLVARNEILARSRLLSAEAVERAGTDVNVLIAAGSAMGDEVVGQLLTLCAGLFLDSAEDVALDKLVFDRYGLVRKPAAPSRVTVNFRTTAPNPTAFSIPVGTALQTSDGIQFVTEVAASFPASSTGPVFVQARSVLAGLSQQVKAGTITNITSQISGSPSDLRVTNNAASAGAADRESDEELRDRARRFWTTARRGTLAAIETRALAVPGVLRATALEAIDAIGRQNRWVYLIVADRFTDALATLNATDPSYAVQSQALASAVFNSLDDTRCGGIFVQVQVAQVVLLQIGLNLTFSAGVDLEEVAARARSRVVSYVNELAPGESFVPADALSALTEVNGLIITGNEIATPSGTVVPKAVQVLRSTFSLALLTGITTSIPFPDPDAVIIQPTTGFSTAP